MPGKTYTYRFVAKQVGTFWYHSHQNSQQSVQKGLFGALIVEPKEPPAQQVKDITVLTHNWSSAGTSIGSFDTLQRMNIAPGTPVRMRLINTDDWTRRQYTLTGTPFQVVSIDGTDLYQRGSMENTRLILPTGGRYDLTFIMPNKPVFLGVNRDNRLGILMSPDGTGDVPEIPKITNFDPLTYGLAAATPFDADSKFDREFTMILGDQLGFYNGQFNFLYTINGEVFPNTPSFMVREGDLVKTTFLNYSRLSREILG